ncbi:MAG: DUF6268 family outer membrane beta-barrel protein [Saprospiraceae bacterium]|nr:DUF6268 family outer membrane beta-barrel protein [Saprospiraceae bacterium]
MYRIYIIGGLLFISSFSKSQSFIFNQFFQPSIRFNSQYSHDFNFVDKDQLDIGQFNINCIIPIKSKLKLKVDWKKILNLQFKKATKLKVYQIFWNFRPKFMYLDFRYKNTTNSNPFYNRPHFSYGFSTGITGIHLLTKPLKKPKFLFYTITLGMMEDYQSLQRSPLPSFRAYVGFAHMKSINFYWYYGIYFSYDNDQIIPAAFLGFQAKLYNKLWLNITLPVQIKLSWKASKKLKIDLGASLSGFSTAFGYKENTSTEIYRYVIGGFRIKTGLNFNFKLSPQFKLYFEIGVFPYQLTNFRWDTPPFNKPELGPSTYGGLSLFYSFKKSLLGSTIDGIIMF